MGHDDTTLWITTEVGIYQINLTLGSRKSRPRLNPSLHYHNIFLFI